MVPEPPLLGRFSRDLDALIAPDKKIGIAVSGGADSLALLLLSAAARPRRIEVATVDHALRPESAGEARTVAALCERLGVPHETLTAEWSEKPQTALQERARGERYRLLSEWAKERKLDAIVTAHQLDDQVETLVMRLNRGSGVRGLAGMRPSGTVPGSRLPLLRPLLGWRRAELEEICAKAGVDPMMDPSNEDEQFERVRVRRGLMESEWLDPAGIAASAANLSRAHSALNWASAREWDHNVFETPEEILYRAPNSPSEIRRRVVARAVAHLATEGRGSELRGRELDRLLDVLAGGGQATLRGVRCSGGLEWRFSRTPARRR